MVILRAAALSGSDAGEGPAPPGRIRRVLRTRLPVSPFLAALLLAVLYVMFLPGINSTWYWMGHRSVLFHGHRIALPFRRSSDELVSPTYRRPGWTIFAPMDDSITVTAPLPGTPDEVTRKMWLYVHGAGPPPAEHGPLAGKILAAFRMMKEETGPAVSLQVEPQWQCFEVPRFALPHQIRAECLAPATLYQLDFWGRAGSLRDAMRIADEMNGAAGRN